MLIHISNISHACEIYLCTDYIYKRYANTVIWIKSASVAKKLRADATGGGGGVDVDVDDDGDVIACQNLTAYYLLFPLFCYRINTHTHARTHTASFWARVIDFLWLCRCALYPRIRIAVCI